MNIRLLIVPSGWSSRSASSRLGQPAVVAELERLTLLGRQLLESAPGRAGAGSPGSRPPPRSSWPVGSGALSSGSPRRRSSRRTRSTARRWTSVRIQVLALARSARKRSAERQIAEERLLHGVLSQRFVAEDPQSEAVGDAAEAVVELGQRLLVGAGDEREQRFVGDVRELARRRAGGGGRQSARSRHRLARREWLLVSAASTPPARSSVTATTEPRRDLPVDLDHRGAVPCAEESPPGWPVALDHPGLVGLARTARAGRVNASGRIAVGRHCDGAPVAHRHQPGAGLREHVANGSLSPPRAARPDAETERRRPRRCRRRRRAAPSSCAAGPGAGSRSSARPRAGPGSAPSARAAAPARRRRRRGRPPLPASRPAPRGTVRRGEMLLELAPFVVVERVERVGRDERMGVRCHLEIVRRGFEGSVWLEHRQLTFGTAWTVIARPAARMTSALAAGRRRTTGPSKLTRRNARRASTATRPMPVIVSASPALNARISTRPKATRWSEIAASRTTSADGQGSSPPETPTASSERKVGPASALLLRRRVVVVMVVVMMVVSVVWARRCAPAGPEHRGADPDHEQARDEVQPRVEPVGDDELRERERHRDRARRRRSCA